MDALLPYMGEKPQAVSKSKAVAESILIDIMYIRCYRNSVMVFGV